MTNFLTKTVVTAGALAVAVWLIDDITLTGDSTGRKAVTLLLVALIFGVLNAVVKPLLQLLSFPVVILTLGLFLLVINALMLMLTSWVADKVDLSFHVDGFWPAFLGALVITIVTWAVEMVTGSD
ncbi:phage holin family protein [Streptomyces sp. NPDC005438]|uniref:phage holin family protein n=1 Tax=Streptomyces sp. NPDC005438 TaxID=3156880 RepID=UPI0033BF12F2